MKLPKNVLEFISRSYHASGQKVKQSHRKLTKKGIGEPVPLAAVLSDEPSAVQTRSETEWRPEHAHEDVAQADVQQDEVDGRPEGPKLREDEQREQVAEDSRH